MLIKCEFFLFVACFSCFVLNVLSTPPPPPPPPSELYFKTLSEDSIDECAKKTGLTKDDMKAEVGTEIPEPKKCMVQCLGTKIKLIKSDGSIDTSVVKENLGSMIADKADSIKECLDGISKPMKTCDDVDEIIKCYPRPEKP
uniref:Putative odorant-binding protein 19 n=1 Tax=Anthonomus grandis TaxID=7044 RepID=A0A2P9JZF6_ANTGR|nr:putative odorant-binding protein 19 [Anthonomus grandis]